MAATRFIMKSLKSKSQGIEDVPREKVANLAKLELRETKEARAHGLEQLRRWIDTNQDISNVRTDEKFVLRFLRAKKFSVPLSEQMILKWLLLRKTFPDMCKGLDCLKESVKQIIDSGYIVVSPYRDSHGRRVIFYNVRNFNAMKYTAADMARVHFLTYETLLEDEDNQVLGFTHVADIEGLSTNHITCWSPTTFARIIRHGEKSTPMRHKEIHLMNVSKAVKYVYDFAKSKISSKINDRILIHDSLTSLHAQVKSSCLPKEYGGEMGIAQMLAAWKLELLQKRPTMLALDDMEILRNSAATNPKGSADENNNANKNLYSLPGSFRKLEVD